jgi:hypothetical protein
MSSINPICNGLWLNLGFYSARSATNYLSPRKILYFLKLCFNFLKFHSKMWLTKWLLHSDSMLFTLQDKLNWNTMNAYRLAHSVRCVTLTLTWKEHQYVAYGENVTTASTLKLFPTSTHPSQPCPLDRRLHAVQRQWNMRGFQKILCLLVCQEYNPSFSICWPIARTNALFCLTYLGYIIYQI